MEEDIKPGVETSEYKGKNKIQIVAAIVALCGALGWKVNPELAQLVVAIGLMAIPWVESAYAKSRGVAKMKKIVGKITN